MALGFFSRLKEGLTRSTQKLTEGLTSFTAVLNKRRLDDAALDELEDLLIGADLGTEVARRVIASFRRSRFGSEVTDDEIKQALAEEIAAILQPVAQPLVLDPAKRPHVVLVVGVNGTGKTTTIGKLAQNYREQGKRAVLVAGDTFRAAAVEQLQIWGERVGAPVIAGGPNADAAGLAFNALTQAAAERRRRAADRHRGSAAQQGRADGRVAQDHARAAASRTRPRRIRCCWCWTRPPGRTPCSRCGCSRRWWT